MKCNVGEMFDSIWSEFSEVRNEFIIHIPSCSALMQDVLQKSSKSFHHFDFQTYLNHSSPRSQNELCSVPEVP